LHPINDSIEFPSINFTSDSLFLNEVNTNITAVSLVYNFATACPIYYVGIDQNEKEAFNVYPNPFTDNITIKVDFTTSYSISIFDISSRLVYNREVGKADSEINLSHLKAGMYTLVCSDYKSEKRMKIVKF
jgi:hypothetical protein